MASLTSVFAILPKPTTMQFSYPKDWGSEESSLYGALASGNVAGAIKSAAAGAAETFTPNTAQAAAQAKYGVAINKRNKALFRDLPFRQVSFAFNLRPRSKDMAAKYMEQIELLKVESAPKLIQDGSLWSVEETTWELTLATSAPPPADILFHSKDLVITDLTVNYTPNGFWSQHKDGYPTQVELSISLMELSLAHKDRLKSKEMV